MKCLCVSLLLACSVSFAQTLFLDEQFDFNRTNDIVYATGAVRFPTPGDKDLLLDLYEPTGAGVPPLKPGFVIIHGSGSDKASGKFVSWASDYAKRGYVCVSINYREQEDDPPTPGDDQQERNVNASVEDAANAIAWLKANAATLGVDPTRIAVGGNSAGAVASLFVGFRELGPTAEVQAVVSYAGAMSNDTHEGHESEIDASDPPVILINSDEDWRAPYSRAVDVANAAAAAGIPYELHLMEGVGHPGVYNQRKTYILPDGDTPFEKIEAFVYTHLQLATIGDPLDSDNDGVPNALDAFPYNPDEWEDADGDGLGDNFEQLIIDFDPLDAFDSLDDVLPDDDFDGDDASNYDEFLHGTDPTDGTNGLPVRGTVIGLILMLVFGVAALQRRARPSTQVEKRIER